MNKGTAMKAALALWRSMGKIEGSRGYANIPPVAFTSSWTDEVVAPLHIDESPKITLKQFLGKDISELSDSCLTPTAKKFQETFTDDWDSSSFKELTDIKKLGEVPVTTVQLATSLRRALMSMRLTATPQEGNFQKVGFDLLSCTGFMDSNLFITEKVRGDDSSNRIEFNMEFNRRQHKVVSVPDLIIWRLLRGNLVEAKAVFGTEVKSKGTFSAALNQIRGESLALAMSNHLQGITNRDGSSSIDFIRIHGMNVGFTSVFYPPGYIDNVLNLRAIKVPAKLTVCAESFSLLTATERNQLLSVLCTLAEKYKKQISDLSI